MDTLANIPKDIRVLLFAETNCAVEDMANLGIDALVTKEMEAREFIVKGKRRGVDVYHLTHAGRIHLSQYYDLRF